MTVPPGLASGQSAVGSRDRENKKLSKSVGSRSREEIRRPRVGRVPAGKSAQKINYVSPTRRAMDKVSLHSPNPGAKLLLFSGGLVLAAFYVYLRITILFRPLPEKQHPRDFGSSVVPVRLVTPKPGSNKPPATPLPSAGSRPDPTDAGSL
jgi:hypothetical protein